MDLIDAEQARKLSLFRPLGKPAGRPVRSDSVPMCLSLPLFDIAGGKVSLIAHHPPSTHTYYTIPLPTTTTRNTCSKNKTYILVELVMGHG